MKRPVHLHGGDRPKCFAKGPRILYVEDFAEGAVKPEDLCKNCLKREAFERKLIAAAFRLNAKR